MVTLEASSEKRLGFSLIDNTAGENYQDILLDVIIYNELELSKFIERLDSIMTKENRFSNIRVERLMLGKKACVFNEEVIKILTSSRVCIGDLEVADGFDIGMGLNTTLLYALMQVSDNVQLGSVFNSLPGRDKVVTPLIPNRRKLGGELDISSLHIFRMMPLNRCVDLNSFKLNIGFIKHESNEGDPAKHKYQKAKDVNVVQFTKNLFITNSLYCKLINRGMSPKTIKDTIRRDLDITSLVLKRKETIGYGKKSSFSRDIIFSVEAYEATTFGVVVRDVYFKSKGEIDNYTRGIEMW